MSETFGDRFRSLRIEKGLKQIQLINDFNAKYHYNFTRAAVSQYENNKRIPEIDALKAFAEYYNVSVDYLLGNSNTRKLDLSEVSNFFPGPGKLINQTSAPDNKHNSEILDQKLKSIPILGTIRAGLPLLAEENWEAEVEVAADLNADFALRVTGDSMSWVGIYDGDLAIFRQANTAYNGDIVACGLNDGDWVATLKFFINDNGAPVLRAANPDYSDIEITPNHKIIGTLVSIEKNPPSINEYKRFLNTKELSDDSWNQVIEKSVQYGLDSNQVIQLIELFSHMVKQIK